MATETLSQCALCRLEISSRPFVEGELQFCCAGCQAVYAILEAKSELEKGVSHPLVKEAASAGLISNPRLLEELQEKAAKGEEPEVEKRREIVNIQGLWCPSCALLIEYVLLQKKGVISCKVDYSTDIAILEYQPLHMDRTTLFEAITKLGYEVELQSDPLQAQASRSLKLRCAISAFCALNVMMFAYPLYATYFDTHAADYGMLFAWLSFWGSLPIMTYCAWPIYKRFWAALRTGYFGMETLIVIGAGSATLLSLFRLYEGNAHVYFDTACVIIALVLGGKLVESKAKFNAKKTLARIAKSQPKRGRKVFDDGKIHFVPISEIYIDDQIKTFSGEKIILDGVVVEGEATCDESLLTGESLPVVKTKGSKVIGGSIILHGNIQWQVKATVEESLQQRILQLVQADIGDKAVKEQRIEVILKYFIPTILLLAVGTLIFSGGNFEQTLSILLIACPCALGIAVPLVESQLIQCLAEKGALVRNRGALQYLGKEDVYVFDKTGTVTKGYLQVQHGLEKLSEDQKLVIYNMAKQSTHPVAQAISRTLAGIEEMAIPITEYVGKGLEAEWKGKSYRIGSESYCRMLCPDLPLEWDCPVGCTVCWIVEDDRLLAMLILGDSLREDIVGLLKQLNSKRTLLLSGDNPKTVAYIAKECGFTAWAAEQTPLQKRETLLNLKKDGYVVAMVGDGINDAPALTAANIGISVVSATDISIQVSDILLTTEKLEVILPVRQLAVKARRLISQNLFWTFIYNLFGIGLALCGYLSPIYSAIAMTASSLIVVFNAQRLSRIFTK